MRLPTLRAHGTQDADLVVPAPRRGVVVVGPVLYRRTDPVGLFARRVRWTGPVELLVRPATTDLTGLPIGQLRDLEGVPSDQISMSDLAFHALREYVRGDDLRHVHWRSSARAGQLLVRQYHDSRRTSTLLVVDTRPSAYARPEDFELALSVAASITVRAGHDGYDLALVCGDSTLGGGSAGLGPVVRPRRLLPGRARPGGDDPRACRTRSPAGSRRLYDASMLFLVTGTAAPIEELQRVVAMTPPDLWASVWRTGVGEAAGLAEYAGRPIVTLGELGQLPVAMNEVIR